MEYDLDVSARQTFTPRAYEDWALRAASRLDVEIGNFINSTLYFGDLKRQAVFACLSEIDWFRPEEMADRLRNVAPDACTHNLTPLAQIARALVTSRARQIVHATYGELPAGFLGALSRLGGRPLDQGWYPVLRTVYADPALHHKAKALHHVGRITEDILRVVDLVDNPNLLSPEIIRLLASQHRAEDFVRTVRWLKDQEHVDGDALDEAIRRSSSKRSLGRTLQHWIERTEQLRDQPVLDDPEFQVLSTVSALREKGIEYRVCLNSSDPIREAVLGLVAFAEWRPTPDELGAIIELRPLLRTGSGERHWMIASINAPDNAPVPRSVRLRVTRGLGALGFFLPVRPAGDDTAAYVSRLMRRLGGDWLADFETA